MIHSRSLDAATLYLFQFINRPHTSLHFSQILRGLSEFCSEYSGQVWVEVMLCGGFNDEVKHILRLREEIKTIGPDRIHLNTVVRPPAEEFAYPLTLEQLEKIAELFEGEAQILPAECPAPPVRVHGQIDREVLALLERRPCSLGDLSKAFGLSEEEMGNYLHEFRRKGVIRYHIHNHTVFYRARSFSSQLRGREA